MEQTKNWVLDDVVDSFENMGLNNRFNDALIKEMAIQKIEYGRVCLTAFFSNLEYPFSSVLKANYNKNDEDLQQKIKELGGTPQNFAIIE